MDAMNEAIVEELLDEQNATEVEREFVKRLVAKTGNPWDVPAALAIRRMMP